ncbi:MAG: site-specific DNA-methyltransferase, partial [Luteimonas sp.]|nr:site-specific DNA-methyltransferase [Luteimonas sp.]
TNRDNDQRGNWKSMDYTCRYTADERPNLYYPVKHPGTGEEIWPNRNRVWAFSPEVHERNVAEGRLWWGLRQQNRVPALKNFFNEINQGMMPMSLWKHSLAGHNQEAKQESIALFGRDEIFETPKPERLLQTILRIATEENDLVLDSFHGSGTTAAVAHKMHRRWIGIEAGDHSRTHCQPRLKKVVDGEQGGISESVDWKGGGGFRFHKLGKPVFDENGHIDESIRFEHLAAHLWFAETGTARSTRAKKGAFLGEHDGIGYYLLFNGILGDEKRSGGNVLTRRVLRSLHKFDGPKVIYGEACTLSEEQLLELDIDFRQTPYDIKAR